MSQFSNYFCYFLMPCICISDYQYTDILQTRVEARERYLYKCCESYYTALCYRLYFILYFQHGKPNIYYWLTWIYGF